ADRVLRGVRCPRRRGRCEGAGPHAEWTPAAGQAHAGDADVRGDGAREGRDAGSARGAPAGCERRTPHGSQRGRTCARTRGGGTVSGQLVQSETVLQPLGRALVTGIYAAAKALRIYPLENAAVQSTIDELDKVVQRLLTTEGVVELRLVGDFLFLNEARLRLNLSDYAAFSNVAGLFHRHQIGELELESGFRREDLPPLLSLLMSEGTGDEHAFERFRQRLAQSTARHVKATEAIATARPDRDDEDQAKEAAKQTYFQ